MMKRIIPSLICFLLAGPLAASPRVAGGGSGNPVFRPAGGVENSWLVSDPYGFGEGEGRFRMWYSSYDRASGRTALSVAFSEDGRNWVDGFSGPLSGLYPGDVDRPVVIYDPDRFGRTDGPLYRIWYSAGPGHDDSIAAIRHAESEDGINWYNDRPIRQSSLFPLVTGGDPVPLSGRGRGFPHYELQNWFHRIKGPGTVIYNPHASNIGSETPNDRSDDDPLSYRFVMYYDSASEGFSPDGSIRQISLAYSTDGIFWIRHGDRPVIVPGGRRGDWDSLYAARASVHLIDGTYHMWYAGGDGRPPAYDARGIGYGTSPDGIDWVLDGDPLLHVDDNESWRLDRTGSPRLVAGRPGPERKAAVAGAAKIGAENEEEYSLYVAGEDIRGESGVGTYELSGLDESPPGRLVPSGPGSLTEWSPVGAASNWECVLEHDGDSTYVYSHTTGQTDRYEMNNLGGSARVNSVTLVVTARKTANPNTRMLLGINSGGSDYLSEITLSTGYTDYTRQWTFDPATGQPWTVESVNALETVIGRDKNHGREARVTRVYLEVDYDPLPDPTPQPTATPIPQPTPSPIILPTPTPAIQPTPTPGLQPTPTASPPTATPTPQPTVQPTPQPTAPPVGTPTPQPTALPNRLIPSGPGSLTQWSPVGAASNWECVLEHDGDSSYAYSNTTGQTDRYQMSDLEVPALVNSVTLVVTARKTANPNTRMLLGIRSGGADHVSEITLSTGYTDYTRQWTSDPATGQPWTVEAVNALETVIGRASNHGREARVTRVYLEVDYEPVPSPTPPATATPTPQPTATPDFPPTPLPTVQPTATPTEPTPAVTPTPSPQPTEPPVATPTPVSTDKEILLSAGKPAILESGGYLEFTVSGAWSYIEVDGVRTDLTVGDRLNLTLGDDGNGRIYGSGDRLTAFTFDDVEVSLDGEFYSSGSITTIYISGYSDLESTLQLSVPRQMAWTQFRVDGTDLINGNDEQRIRVWPVKPDGSGAINFNNEANDIWFTGGAEEFLILPPTTPTPTAHPTRPPTHPPDRHSDGYPDGYPDGHAVSPADRDINPGTDHHPRTNSSPDPGTYP